MNGRSAAPRALPGLVALLTSLLVAALVGLPAASSGASRTQLSPQERVRTATPAAGQLRPTPQPVGVRLARGGAGTASLHRRTSSTAERDEALFVRAIAAATPTGDTGPAHLVAVLAPLAVLLAPMVSRPTRRRPAPPAIGRTPGLTRPRAPPHFA